MAVQVNHKTLLRVKKRMLNSDNWDTRGICRVYEQERGLLSRVLRGDWAEHRALEDLMTRWPGYSGQRIFPVPHPTLSPDYAYYECGPIEMWDRELSEYARSRWELLEWMIEETK